MVNDQGFPVNVTHSLDIVDLFPQWKCGPHLYLLIHSQFCKAYHLGGIGLFVPGHSLLHALNIAQEEFRLLLGLIDHLHPFSVDALHISLIRQPAYGPAHRVPGTVKLLYKGVLRCKQVLIRIGSAFDPVSQLCINMVIFCFSHDNLSVPY